MFRPAHRVAAMSEFKHPNRRGVPFCSCFINLSSSCPGIASPLSAASETVEQGLDRHGQGTARKNESSNADNSHSFSFVESKIVVRILAISDIAKKGSALLETPTAITTSPAAGAPTSATSTALATSAGLPNDSIWIAFMLGLSDMKLPYLGSSWVRESSP